MLFFTTTTYRRSKPDRIVEVVVCILSDTRAELHLGIKKGVFSKPELEDQIQKEYMHPNKLCTWKLLLLHSGMESQGICHSVV